jgi:hypothetical protein
MAVMLQIIRGSQKGRSIEVAYSEVVTVGRSIQAGIVIPDDRQLNSIHFELEHAADGCWVRDLDSTTGTFVNDVAISERYLNEGDEVRAGTTTFSIQYVEDAVPWSEEPEACFIDFPAPPPPAPKPAAPPPMAPAQPHDLLTYLRGLETPLYALLDAARDPKVFDLLSYSEEEYRSLYAGAEGEELADWAPYLVKLSPGGPFLEKLVQRGWGQSWGVYLTCDKDFAEVRKHFRRFLKAHLEGKGTIYFRFYDPRVLRFFLPTCTEEQTTELFGPVQSYLIESKDPRTMLQFKHKDGDLQQQKVALKPIEATAPRAPALATSR